MNKKLGEIGRMSVLFSAINSEYRSVADVWRQAGKSLVTAIIAAQS